MSKKKRPPVRRTFSFRWSESLQTAAPAAAPDHADYQEQHDGADECHENGSSEASEGCSDTKRPEEPASDESAEDTNDDITNETQSSTAHHE